MSGRPVTSLLLAPVGAGLLSSFTVNNPDPDDVGALYDRYAGIVFSLALRIVRDRQLATEILEEVFLRAWHHAQAPRTARGTVFAWLVEMTRAIAIEAADDRHPPTEVTRAPSTVIPGSDAYVSETQQAVTAVLASLPPKQRQAMELVYFEGLTVDEIAQSLDVPVETVHRWLGQGIRTIGEALRPSS